VGAELKVKEGKLPDRQKRLKGPQYKQTRLQMKKVSDARPDASLLGGKERIKNCKGARLAKKNQKWCSLCRLTRGRSKLASGPQ